MSADLLAVAISAAVLLSYWFNHFSERYGFPSVVLLLGTGIAARLLVHLNHGSLDLPSQLLPLLGTGGLVLIVLEGALDLRLSPGRRAFLLGTLRAAALGLAATTLLISLPLKWLFGLDWLQALLVAVPCGVICCAGAIPSAMSLGGSDREFVIYESSWADILGVTLFNALLVATHGGPVAANLVLGSAVVIGAGACISLLVFWLVGHLQGHVKFVPLLFALILVYAGADSLHLSPLLIVLIMGLTLNNPQVLRRFRFLDRLHSTHYETELERLKHLTSEATFLARTFFFLALGYATDMRTLADPAAWALAAAIVSLIVGLRWGVLKLTGVSRMRPLLWLAPRGLVTATLFFALPAASIPADFPPGTLILVVLLSCLVMVVGMQVDRPTVPQAEATPNAAD